MSGFGQLMMRKKSSPKTINMTKVGDVFVDNNYIASNFSDFNYFTWDVTQYNVYTATTWEMQTKMFVEENPPASPNDAAFVFNSPTDQRNFRFGLMAVNTSVFLTSRGSAWINTSSFSRDISDINGKWVWFKFGYDSSRYYYISYSFDGINYTKLSMYYSTYKVNFTTIEYVGKPNRTSTISTIRGYMLDLNETKLIKDGTVVWTALS